MLKQWIGRRLSSALCQRTLTLRKPQFKRNSHGAKSYKNFILVKTKPMLRRRLKRNNSPLPFACRSSAVGLKLEMLSVTFPLLYHHFWVFALNWSRLSVTQTLKSPTFKQKGRVKSLRSPKRLKFGCNFPNMIYLNSIYLNNCMLSSTIRSMLKLKIYINNSAVLLKRKSSFSTKSKALFAMSQSKSFLWE